MTRKTFRTPALVVAAAVALLLAACGVDSSESLKTVSSPDQVAEGPSPTSPDAPDGPGPDGPGEFQGTGGVVFLNRAAEATSEVKTQSMEMRMSMDVGGSSMDVVINGQIDLENDLMQMDMDLGLGDLFGDLQDEFDDLDLDMGDLGFDPSDMTMTMIQDGDQLYMKSPMFSMFTGSDKPWIVVPVDEAELVDETQGAQDPNDFLEFLKATNAEVVEHGREDVRGVSTVHLSTVLDMREILEQAEGVEKEELEEALEGLGTAAEEIPMDVWIDDDGMIRRMTMEIDASGIDDEVDMGTMELTIELFDFGEPVDIRVPDASEVAELDFSDMGGDFDF